jgi:ubiquinone/menaquinone biosynthesis C-methylase UbiE
MRAGRLFAVAVVMATVPQMAFAQRVTHTVDEWVELLESPARQKRVEVLKVVEALKLQPGMTVGDIGAGTGVFTLPMALAVKPGGEVYAVELSEEATAYIEEKATEQGLVNVKGAVGTAADPNMPVNVDLALLHDSLRYIEQQADYVKMLSEYLMPGGRIAIIEYKPDQYPDRPSPELVVTEEQATEWAVAAGLKVVEKVTTFPDRWFVIFAK